MGVVLGGTVLQGTFTLGSVYYLGPSKGGTFIPISIKSIQENRINTQIITTGTSACVSIKAAGQTSTSLDLQSLLKTSYKRKGLFLIGINAKYAQSKQAQKSGGIPQMLEAMCVRSFEAEVKILHHATTIQEKY